MAKSSATKRRARISPQGENAVAASVGSSNVAASTVQPASEILPLLARAALLVFLVAVVWGRSLVGGLLWDDAIFVRADSASRSFRALTDVWLGRGLDYFPITSTLFWLERQLFGAAPLGYRVVDLLLHAGVCIALWRLLMRLKIPGAWWAAALFAVHPLCGASAAWISEQKNTLSLLLALIAAAQHSAAQASQSRRRHIVALLWFVLALLAKPSIAGLPVVIWTLDVSRGESPRKALRVIAPWLVAALALGIVTTLFQRSHLGAPVDPIVVRVVRVPFIAGFYLVKALWPLRLAMVYERGPFISLQPMMWVAWLTLLSVAMVCWLRRATWGRAAAVALMGWFAMLAPVLGVVPMAFHRFAYVSDHLVYPALPVLFASIAALLCQHAEGGGRRVMAAIVVVNAGLGFARAPVFLSRESLWQDSVEHAPEVALSQGNLALELAVRGDNASALEHAERAIALDSGDPDVYAFVGVVYMQADRLDDAERAFRRALSLNPTLSNAHNNLASILHHRGDVAGAIEHIRAAVDATPDYATGHMNLARLLASVGRSEEARAEWNRAVTLDPSLSRYPLPSP